MINQYRPEGLLLGDIENRSAIFGGRHALEKAMQCGNILESIVTLCDNDLNLYVDLGGIKGIIPKNEVCYTRSASVKDIAIITRVGKPVCFKVTSITEIDGKVTAYLSRRDAQMDCYNNYIDTLIPGDIIPSRVTHLESFGAFVDIGCGIIALLPVDCISVSRFTHPRDRLFKGMVISTVLKTIDEEKNRIFVTMRELLGTWAENAAEFSPGQTVTGIIRSVEDYGVFVELTPNLAGLAELKDDVTLQNVEGKHFAAVYIKSIIPERMKIKLVLIDTYSAENEKVKIKYFTDINNVTHIGRWRYSPYNCPRVIETVFDE